MVTAEMVEQRKNTTHQRIRVRRVWRRRPALLCRLGGKRLIVFVGLLLLVLCANIILQAYVAKTRYELTKCDAEIAKLERKISIEALKIADISSERYIEQVAEERFGMRPAQPHEIAYMPTLERVNTPHNEAENAASNLMLASVQSEQRHGLSERFVAWLQGIGRTKAGTNNGF